MDENIRPAQHSEFAGIPATGKRIERAYTSILGVENGKMIEEWSRADDLGTRRQAGVLP